MLVLVTLCTLAILAALLYGQALAVPPHPVCIVGAGPGGLTIAHELEAKGISTIVFEKQRQVGGKCQSVYDGTNSNTYHPMGALIFTNSTWVNTLPLIKASGLPVTLGPSTRGGRFYGSGTAASTVVPIAPVSDAATAYLVSELERYSNFWTSEFAPQLTAPRYTNGVPKELAVPMAEWLKSQGYVALPDVIRLGMAPYGYGDISETPAIYMLQYFTPDILSAFVGLTPTYDIDFHKVMVNYADSLKGPVRINAQVTAIDRSGDVPTVFYNQDAASAKQLCNKVVLAFAPTLENLEAIDMTLSSDEYEVFSKVQITSYWSSAVETKVDSPSVYLQTPFQANGAPVSFIRLFNESPITTAWSWDTLGSTTPLSKVTELLVQTITDVQTGLGIPGPIVRTSDVKDIRKQDYFPHFGSTDLADGLYDKYNALQGQQNTFYSSALSGFELVEFAIRAGKELVETFF